MLELIIEHRQTGEGKVVSAPIVSIPLLLQWIRDNYPGYGFYASRDVA